MPEATRGVPQRVFGTLDELLADPEVEIVDIATHPAARVEPIRRALAAGKHVLAQKPLALSLELTLAAVRSAERGGRPVSVAGRVTTIS